MEPLVSIITPCYNMEKKIRRYLESLMKQNYANIEVILVNDGSIDNTGAIIKEYIPQFEEKGYRIKYIVQENGGAAAAIRTGLNQVTGEYLMWPDADDILMENSVRSKVDFLEKHPEYAFVRTNAYVIHENNFEDRSQLIVKTKNLRRHKIYQECIRFKTFYCPGCFMVRWSDFLKANPDKYIFQTYYGQNIQMLVPLAYYYECGYINEPQYGYIVYEDSHSHLGGKKTYERKMNYSRKVEEITLKTLEHMSCVPCRDFVTVKNDFRCRRVRIAYEAGIREDAIAEYKGITGVKKFNPAIMMMAHCKKNIFTDLLATANELLEIAVFQMKNRR